MSVATNFLLIRHAAHDYLSKVLVGRTPAVHLNEEGHRQAVALAEQLSDAPLAAVYSSPLERAFETAAPIAATRDFDLQIADGFNEIDFGIWTGKPFAELDKRKDWQRWNRARALAVAPGGEKMWLAQRRAVYELESMCVRHFWRGIAHKTCRCPDRQIGAFKYARYCPRGGRQNAFARSGLAASFQRTKLVGMVTERHPDRSAAGHGHDPNVVRVAENMSRDLVYCYEDQSREEAGRIMAGRGLRYLPVVDREMRIVGMISQHDLDRAPSESTASATMRPPGASATSLEQGETP